MTEVDATLRDPSCDDPERPKSILNVRADALEKRSRVECLLYAITAGLAHPAFFAAELLFHAGWVIANVGWIPGIEPWDPYPFILLTGLASMQALFIVLLIVMYTEHNAKIAEVRAETELQVSLHAERETTKVLQLLQEIHERVGLTGVRRDPEVEEMSRPLDPHHIKRTAELEIKEVTVKRTEER